MNMFLKNFQVPFYKAENVLRGDELLLTFNFCINQCLFTNVLNGIDDKGRMKLISFLKIYQTLQDPAFESKSIFTQPSPVQGFGHIY